MTALDAKVWLICLSLMVFSLVCFALVDGANINELMKRVSLIEEQLK